MKAADTSRLSAVPVSIRPDRRGTSRSSAVKHEHRDSANRPTGADLIVDALAAHGIDRLYVYPGGTIAPILESAKRRGLAIFCSRHEQGAGYAALAAARLGNSPQVAMVTSGPGVTNIVTTVADAYFDSTPLILLTGQVGTADLQGSPDLRQRGFQQVDTCALMQPVSKRQLLAERTSELPQLLARAFYEACSGRPGPVVIDLPMDIQRGTADSESAPFILPREEVPGPCSSDMETLLEWLTRSRRPVVIAGQGVLLSQAHQELRTLIEGVGIPISHSMLGLGAVPSTSPYSLGYHGHTGNQYAGKAIHHADLLIAVGSRLDVRQTGTRMKEFVPQGKIVRIDVDHSELDHSPIRCDLAIRADARHTLAALNAALAGRQLPDWSEWHREIARWKERYPLTFDRNGPLKPQLVIETVAKLTRRRPVCCVSGVGSHQQWVARHFNFDFPRRRWLTSGGHGAMGYDLPSAVGAQLYDPESLVLCFVGDGSLQMNIQELATISELQLPLKIFVLDNRRLGIVSQFQNFNWNDDPTTGQKWNPDFAAIAAAYGLTSQVLKDSNHLDAVVQHALETDGPVLIHCLIDQQEDVMPMLMGGQTLDKMWPYD